MTKHDESVLADLVLWGVVIILMLGSVRCLAEEAGLYNDDEVPAYGHEYR